MVSIVACSMYATRLVHTRAQRDIYHYHSKAQFICCLASILWINGCIQLKIAHNMYFWPKKIQLGYPQTVEAGELGQKVFFKLQHLTYQFQGKIGTQFIFLFHYLFSLSVTFHPIWLLVPEFINEELRIQIGSPNIFT